MTAPDGKVDPSRLRGTIIFVSDRGAVIRYSVHAVRGNRRLDTEQLLMLGIENERIVEATFAPFDQAEYDRFFMPP